MAEEHGTVTKQFFRLRYIFKGIVFLARRFPRSALVILLLSILAGAIPACTAWVGKGIVDDVVGRLKGADPTARLAVLGYWIAAVLTPIRVP